MCNGGVKTYVNTKIDNDLRDTVENVYYNLLVFAL